MAKDPARCGRSVKVPGTWSQYRQCSRKIWKDGVCKIHHIETMKARAEKAHAKDLEIYKKTPFYKLQEALERIKGLEAEIERLKAKEETWATALNATKDGRD